jgi:hypothetical protein
VKLPSLLPVHANDDSVEEVTDTRVIDLDSHSRESSSCSLEHKRDLLELLSRLGVL